MLKGKKGRFRGICLETGGLFRPFGYCCRGEIKTLSMRSAKDDGIRALSSFPCLTLVEHGFATNVKGANRIIERNRPEVWEVLEEVISERPVYSTGRQPCIG